MTDYSKLVEALRSASTVSTAWEKLMLDAAAAIEELQQIAGHYEQTAKDYWKEACEYHAIVLAKGITAKESEELIRKFKKLPCGPIEPNEPKRGEKYPFRCPNCGTVVGVMEVQE